MISFWLFVGVLTFNAVVGVVCCYEQAYIEWHNKRVETLRKRTHRRRPT